MRICSVHGCGREVEAKGFCKHHWAVNKRRGCIPERTRLDPNDIRVEGDVAYIVLRDTLGSVTAEAIIDIASLEMVKQHKWYLNNHGYVLTRVSRHEQKFLHRMLTNCPDGLFVDHIDRNPLNNQISNLRLCTIAQNQLNHKVNVRNNSGYPGVSLDKRVGKWRARLGAKWLGRYSTPEEAYAVYQKELSAADKTLRVETNPLKALVEAIRANGCEAKEVVM